MGWVGKALGGLFGFALGGPFGAIFGGILGHGVDRGVETLRNAFTLPLGNRARVESVFFTTTFSTMGHMAKADGRVSQAEIALAEAIMAQLNLSPDRRRAAIALFRQGKLPDFDLGGVVAAFRTECRGQRALTQMFLEILLQAAYADGDPSPSQRRVLEQVRAGLGIPEILFRQLENLVRLQRSFAGGPRPGGAGAGGGGGARSAPVRGPSLSQAYAVLGVKPKDSDATIKRAYRRLLSQHHPDKLVSKGLPEEMMKMAAQKTHEIRRAYEMIQEARGMA
jgi:DnaJ like chaperone protein